MSDIPKFKLGQPVRCESDEGGVNHVAIGYVEVIFRSGDGGWNYRIGGGQGPVYGWPENQVSEITNANYKQL